MLEVRENKELLPNLQAAHRVCEGSLLLHCFGFMVHRLFSAQFLVTGKTREKAPINLLYTTCPAPTRRNIKLASRCRAHINIWHPKIITDNLLINLGKFFGAQGVGVLSKDNLTCSLLGLETCY